MSNSNDQSTYEFKGIPLTSGVLEQVIPSIYQGNQVVRRSQIINDVVSHHHKHGGLPSGSKSVTSMVKKALQTLVESGIAQRPTVGYYRFIKIVPVEVEGSHSVEIGSGSEHVYAYHFPAYKSLYELKGHTSWPMKIGKSILEVEHRVLDQTTAMPEVPVIAFQLKCVDSHRAERIFHDVLKSRNRHLTEAPGKEWFLTNPDELKDIAINVIDS